jgi:signal peptidase I
VIAVSFLVSKVLTSFITITVVSGESMLPTYQDKDIVVTIKQDNYAIGDPVVYQPDTLDCEQCHIIHRIIDGNGTDGWITQGDNNARVDPWQPTNEEVRGVVVAHIQTPEPLHIIYVPQLWFTILSGIILLFFIDVFYHYWKQSHEEDESVSSDDETAEDSESAARERVDSLV